MPISFSTNKEVPRGTAFLGVPVSTDSDGKINVGIIMQASKDDLAEALLFAGFLKGLATDLKDKGFSPTVIYHPDDYAEHGSDLPYGFEFEDE